MTRPPSIPTYTVAGPLGYGARGTTWSVTDQFGTARVATLIDAASASYAARLAQLLGLAHTAVVQVREIVELEGGGWAVIQDEVSGPSLATLVGARGRLSFGEIAGLWKALADGLAALHARGVIHGDISPGNIICGVDGPVFIDIVGHGGSETGRQGYVAPEVESGGTVDEASDVWALARTLVWAGGEHVEIEEKVGAALSDDPAVRPAARAFALWSFTLAPPLPLELPAAAELAGAHLRAAAPPTNLRGAEPAPIPKRAMLLAAGAAVAVAGLWPVVTNASSDDTEKAIGSYAADDGSVSGDQELGGSDGEDSPEPPSEEVESVEALLQGEHVFAADAELPHEVETQFDVEAVLSDVDASGGNVAHAILAGRDEALNALDRARLADLTVAGSRVAESDSNVIDAFENSGSRVEGFHTEIIRTAEVAATSTSREIEVTYVQRPYIVISADGSVNEIEAGEPVCVRIAFEWLQTWKAGGLSPCENPPAID